MSQNKKVHPCQECGACCAHFRVAFYWREAEERVTVEGAPDRKPVPLELTEEQDEFHRNMKGTNEKYGRKCVALDGRIGKFVACQIYQNRPTPCREFAASYEDGTPKPRCDDARAAHGLKPLTIKDW